MGMRSTSTRLGLKLMPFAMAAVLSACGNQSQPQSTESMMEKSGAQKQAELDVRAADLARREAELTAKQAEQENDRLRAEAEATKQERMEAERTAAAKATAQKRAAARRAAEAQASAGAAAQPVVNAPEPLHVGPGTQLAIQLASDLSSKTNHVGDSFEARVVSDVLAGGRVAVPAGSLVIGSITNVVSGANSIGAIPLLALRLDRLEMADGRSIPIHGELQQVGESEKVRDTAKIVGGAAVGAVAGHQVRNDNRGKVIGGILGALAGTAIAKKTGTEVQLPAGSQLNVVLNDGFSVTRS